MQFQFIQPHEALKPYIKHYWTMESSTFESDVCERVIPTANVQLMFHYRKPFVVKNNDSTLTHQPKSIISGINNSYFDVSTSGQAGVIAVVFNPTGACHFFRFPLMEVENQSVNLRDIFNKEIMQIEEKICNETLMGKRIEVIEEFLLQKLLPIHNSNLILIQNSLNLLKQNRGQISALELSGKLSVTTKSLERKFSALLGKTPKQFIKLIRFQEVVLDISRNRNIDLTEYAYRYGYFDQSHFIKDFKNYTGYTPKEFLSLCPCDHIVTDFGI